MCDCQIDPMKMSMTFKHEALGTLASFEVHRFLAKKPRSWLWEQKRLRKTWYEGHQCTTKS